METEVLKQTVMILAILASASQANAVSDKRAQKLFDVLEQSLRCEAISNYLKNTLSDERQRLRKVWMSAGIELGDAMLAGQYFGIDGGYGRRCLSRYQFPVSTEISETDAAFNIGLKLGKARACFSEIFTREMLGAVPTGPLLGGNSKQEEDDRSRIQQFALDLYEERNCRYVHFPE